MLSPLRSVGKGVVFGLSTCHVHPFVRSFVQTDLVITVSREWLEQLEETDSEYSSAPSDNLIRSWRSKVKVTAGRRGGEGVDVVEVQLLVYFSAFTSFGDKKFLSPNDVKALK